MLTKHTPKVLMTYFNLIACNKGIIFLSNYYLARFKTKSIRQWVAYYLATIDNFNYTLGLLLRYKSALCKSFSNVLNSILICLFIESINVIIPSSQVAIFCQYQLHHRIIQSFRIYFYLSNSVIQGQTIDEKQQICINAFMQIWGYLGG